MIPSDALQVRNSNSESLHSVSFILALLYEEANTWVLEANTLILNVRLTL